MNAGGVSASASKTTSQSPMMTPRILTDGLAKTVSEVEALMAG